MTQRTLGEWLAYLEQLHPSAIDMGLERSREVANRMGLLKPAPRVITVTGTNGKGSTCAFVASLLQAQGLTVGVYNSPHLLRYNERVQIAGVEVSDEQLCEAFAAVDTGRGDTSLTYFEVGTLAAFWLFERAKLDAVVLEVGLGGRLDAVNLVDADIALVTSIGVDHVEYLGNTRESVAYEKAGIFRPGKPAICGDANPPHTLIDKAEQLGSPLFVLGRDFDLTVKGTGWGWCGRDGQGRVLSLHDLPVLDLPMENAALAIQAYALMDLPWQPAVIANALVNTRVVGRLDRRQFNWHGKTLTVMLDVGHNPHAAQYLVRRLAQRPPVGKRLAVFGMLADKDLDGVISVFTAVPVEHWAVAPLDTGRTRCASEIETALKQHGACVSVYGSVAAALEAQCERALPEDEILLFGSFYCVAQALEWLERRATEEAANGSAG